ncbi:MAG: response regulator [Nitrosomonas ureae]
MLDLNMPGKSELEALKELKNDLDLRGILVIIYTSSTAKEDIKPAYQSYADGYIKKSADCIKIVKVVQYYWFSTSIFYEP